MLSWRVKEHICHTTELKRKKFETEMYISLILQSVHSVMSKSTAATLLRKPAFGGASIRAAVLRDTIKGTHV